MIRVIKQSHDIWGPCPDDYVDNLKWIEFAGRICYQSQDKITDDSYIKFTDMLCDKGHWAMLEHSNFVIMVRYRQSNLDDSKFIYRTETGRALYYSGNYRAFMEALGFKKLKEIKNLMNYQVPFKDQPWPCKSVSVIFKTNRAMTLEQVRHRPASYAQLSQRYVSHTGRTDMILPVQYYDKTEMNPKYDKWYEAMNTAMSYYRDLREYGESPQQARNVLPNSIATEIVVTASLPEWRHIFNLRCSKAADPQMQDLMKPVMDEFIQNGWMNVNEPDWY